ncbi:MULTISPECIES: hypothetical protein [Mesorhizobium]|nr:MULTISPECIES: hypothetical protein [Mesorhizobium]
MPVASVGLKSMSLPEFGEPMAMTPVARNTHGDREHAANMEDGIALADDAPREGLAARCPQAWSRVEARRAFRSDVGIRLKPEVLPFSNIPAFPFWLSRNTAMAVSSR